MYQIMFHPNKRAVDGAIIDFFSIARPHKCNHLIGLAKPLKSYKTAIRISQYIIGRPLFSRSSLERHTIEYATENLSLRMLAMKLVLIGFYWTR